MHRHDPCCRLLGCAGKLRVYQETGAGFDELWQALEPFVNSRVRGALRITLGHSQANSMVFDELIQDVAIRLARLHGKSRTGGFRSAFADDADVILRAWLSTLVKRVVCDHCRRDRRAARRRLVAWNDEQLNAISVVASNGEIATEKRPDLFRLVSTALTQLPESLAMTAYKVWIEQKTTRVAAAELRVSQPTISQRIKRARDLVGKILETEGIGASTTIPRSA
jgi:RNA polymerase sigma factor (sigma-70 family)